jgi:hypothetical protein
MISRSVLFTIINAMELHLSGLIGMARLPDIQKIRIIGFLFEKSYIDS